MESQAVLAGMICQPADARAGLLAMLLRRIDGMVNLCDSNLLMFRAFQEHLDAFDPLTARCRPIGTAPR